MSETGIDLAISAMNPTKFDRVLERLQGNEFEVVECKKGEGDPDAYIMSPRLFNLLKTSYEQSVRLMSRSVAKDRYDELAKKNEVLRSIVRELTQEVKRVVGDDCQISEAGWTRISRSIREAVEQDPEEL